MVPGVKNPRIITPPKLRFSCCTGTNTGTRTAFVWVRMCSTLAAPNPPESRGLTGAFFGYHNNGGDLTDRTTCHRIETGRTTNESTGCMSCTPVAAPKPSVPFLPSKYQLLISARVYFFKYTYCESYVQLFWVNQFFFRVNLILKISSQWHCLFKYNYSQ